MDFGNKLSNLQNILTTELLQTTPWGFVLNLALAALLSFIIARFFTKYGRTLSNRRGFSANFILLAMTVTLIITIVRSSLALSLGLIGALSIVRFRAAIKEPEELSYLFFVISVGLGFGANQRILTIIAVIVILLLLRFKNLSDKKNEPLEQNLYLNITTKNPQKLKYEQIKNILAKHCATYRARRVDQNDFLLEACFLVEFKSEDSLSGIESELREADGSIKITFLDNKGGSLAIS